MFRLVVTSSLTGSRVLGRLPRSIKKEQIRYFKNERAAGWNAMEAFEEDNCEFLTDAETENQIMGEAFEEDFLKMEQSYLAQAEDGDSEIDQAQALAELKDLKAEMADKENVLDSEWILNPANDTYFNPSTLKTKVPFEKSWKEYQRRRADRTRKEMIKVHNEEFPDFLKPVEMHPTVALFPENEMRIVRKKYNHLDFKKLNESLSEADSKFFQMKPAQNMLPFQPQLQQNEQEHARADWETENLKFLGLLKHKFHIATFRRTHSTKVGRKHSWGALVVGGNGKGWAGFGYGKGLTPELASNRAAYELRKNFTDIPLDEGRTIPSSIVGRHGKVKVIMKRCVRGRGAKGGPIMMSIIDSVGISDISTKVTGSQAKNPLHVVYAAFKGLSKLESPREMALARGVNYYEAFEPIIREAPPTRAELQSKATEIQAHMETASKEWRKRADLTNDDHDIDQGHDDELDADELNRDVALLSTMRQTPEDASRHRRKTHGR